MRIKVNVTQENIDEGERNNCFKCPVSLSLKDMGYEDVIFRKKYIKLTYEGIRYRYYTIKNKKATPILRFANLYDVCRKVEPNQFELTFIPYKTKRG